MHRPGYFWLPVTLSLAVLFPSPAIADTIRITGGFVEFGGAIDLSSIQRGFRLLGGAYGGGTSPNVFVSCGDDECNPGEVATLSHAFGGLDLGVESVTLDGLTFNDVNSLGSPASAEIGFSSTNALPPLSSTAILSTPFMMQGSFSHPGGVETLFGSGVLTTRWISASGPSGSPVWGLEAARYEFQEANPVPEPGTIALVGATGAVAALVRRRRRVG